MEGEVYGVPECFKQPGAANLQGLEAYKKLYEESIRDPHGFWDKMAKQFLSWSLPYENVVSGGFQVGDTAWFMGGKLNPAYNCIDRHLKTKSNQVAILWEGDEPDQVKKITYQELYHNVCRFSNLLLSEGVQKGDRVAVYMPMVPEAIYAMLACARIGAVHSVVFAGFSAEALRSRVLDANAKIVITAETGCRCGKTIPLKQTVDEALLGCLDVKRVFVLRTTAYKIPWHPTRDVDLTAALSTQRPVCPPALLDSEDPLFILYTSGIFDLKLTQYKEPKGVVHTVAGYLLFAAMSMRYVFDYKDGDIHGCVADIGWITGHTYIVYGPLMVGGTTFMFESIPIYPNASRYWQSVQKHRLTSFYTAPTAIRTLMRYGEKPFEGIDLSSLRILGTVGEPISPEAWKWYYNNAGKGKCAVVDTYWQTETGACILTTLPGAIPMKPGSAGYPFFGIQFQIVDSKTGVPVQPDEHGNRKGVLCINSPWPGMARTVFGDHSRFMKTYLQHYKDTYFTGDGCLQDKDGYYWISGRVDDVINKSGHRLGTAEIEGALALHPAIAEAAVVAVPDEIRGQAIAAFCSLKHGFERDKEGDLEAALKLKVKQHIGGIATPDYVIITHGLPKTRSGKIMRRLLRKLALYESDLGDISTLAEPHIVEELREKVKNHIPAPK